MAPLSTAAVALALALLPVSAPAAAMSDAEVTRTIEADLQAYDGVDAHLIDISTSEGVVTLHGPVDNLLARDQAVALAKSIKGVRSVIDQTSIRTVHRTDREIHTDVQRAMESDSATESWQIEVAVEDGTVTLAGQVESWQERQLAGQITKSTLGVRNLKNDILYVPTVERPDQDLAAEIRQGMKMDARIDADKIEVKVNDGEVQLSGYVSSSSEKSLAEELSWVNGVRDVSGGKLLVD
jgi:osmotically-inducible protein OsmY